jgi:hypothetical protein
VAWKVFGAERIGRMPKCGCSELVGARCATDAHINAARVKRLEHCELFGHNERSVVGQHDPAGSDMDLLSQRSEMRDEDGGRGARHAGHVVMLRNPKAAEAKCIGMHRESGGIAERVAA